MPNLVGTGLDQVPTNSMLGGMAYQSPDHASIKDLDLKNISQINSEIADTAVDVFIYDTSKDSDGGAWRKRTSHTSWYNETLGTATRGTRREFPAVAVLVLSAHKLTIYDGDDPDLPMWMEVYQYVGGGNSGTTTNWHGGSGTFSAVAAINGIIICGTTGTRNLHFVNDRFSLFYSPASGNYTQRGGISIRNVAYTSWGPSDQYYAQLVNTTVNDVAMTVMPNAPIDSATGLPIPTIAVATEGGITIIKEDGSVVDINSDNNVGTLVEELDFYNNSQLIVTWVTVGAGTRNTYSYNIPASDTTASASPIGRYVDSSTASGTRLYFSRDQARTIKTVGFKDKKNFVLVPNTFNPSIVIVDEDQTGNEGANGMVAHIRSDYNTGWMHGSIKGAFLSDTDDTDKTNGQTDPDRSANNNALTVTGTITKTPVATGADLVGYSGFSASNQLGNTSSYNFDSGTSGSMCIIGWFKTASISTYHYILSVKSTSSGHFFGLAINSPTSPSPHPPGTLYLYDNITGQTSGTGVVNDGQWHCAVGILDGYSRKIYLDGELEAVDTYTNSVDLSSTDKLVVGRYSANDSFHFPDSLALTRISKSIPSAEQVKKMYEDEKCLFYENAKCTLYGSSDAVTALAYDEVTDLLHVGTSGGRSAFSGLKRVENTTTAVTTAISAHDGFIIEQ